MRHFATMGLVAAGALVAAPIPAQTIYKSIDAEGNTVFSDTPPPSSRQPVQEITPPPPPSATEVREAEAQDRQTQQLNQQYERDRKTREAEQAAQDAANPQTTVVPRGVVPVPVPVVPADPYLRERREALPGERPIGERPVATPREPRHRVR